MLKSILSNQTKYRNLFSEKCYFFSVNQTTSNPSPCIHTITYFLKNSIFYKRLFPIWIKGLHNCLVKGGAINEILLSHIVYVIMWDLGQYLLFLTFNLIEVNFFSSICCSYYSFSIISHIITISKDDIFYYSSKSY